MYVVRDVTSPRMRARGYHYKVQRNVDFAVPVKYCRTLEYAQRLCDLLNEEG